MNWMERWIDHWYDRIRQLTRKNGHAHLESDRDAALNRYLETYKCKGDGECCRMGVYCGDCMNAYLKMHMGNSCPGPGCTYCDGYGRQRTAQVSHAEASYEPVETNSNRNLEDAS